MMLLMLEPLPHSPAERHDRFHGHQLDDERPKSLSRFSLNVYPRSQAPDCLKLMPWSGTLYSLAEQPSRIY